MPPLVGPGLGLAPLDRVTRIEPLRPEVRPTPARRAANAALIGLGEHQPSTDELAALLRRDAELRALRDPRLQRPPAWSGGEVPQPGCWCSCCRSQHWWSEADRPRGWRCWLCHPPLPGVTTTELRTDREPVAPATHHNPTPQES
jgi:hypothetical protein